MIAIIETTASAVATRIVEVVQAETAMSRREFLTAKRDARRKARSVAFGAK